MSSPPNSPTVGAAAAQCTRSMGKGIALIAACIAGIALLYQAGLLIGTAWTAWQSFMTNQWTNVWPATWTVWTCTLLAAWCACMAYKLRHSNTGLWFGATCAALVLFGVIPANCAVVATVGDWNIREMPLLDRVAGASATIYALVGFLTPMIAFVNFLLDLSAAEQTK